MTHHCELPPDMVNIITTFAWGVVLKKHIFDDIARICAYRCAIPDIFLAKFVPSLSPFPKRLRENIGHRLMTNHYHHENGFTQHMCECFVGNPYRTDQPYWPSCDIPRLGLWSNTLWYLIDLLTAKAFTTHRFYRVPTMKRLRKLWCGPVDNWNQMFEAIIPWQGALEDLSLYRTLYLWEETWPALIAEQIGSAEFAEVLPEDTTGNCLDWVKPDVQTIMVGQSRRPLL